jgi:hypothetical protein
MGVTGGEVRCRLLRGTGISYGGRFLSTQISGLPSPFPRGTCTGWEKANTATVLVWAAASQHACWPVLC